MPLTEPLTHADTEPLTEPRWDCMAIYLAIVGVFTSGCQIALLVRRRHIASFGDQFWIASWGIAWLYAGITIPIALMALKHFSNDDWKQFLPSRAPGSLRQVPPQHVTLVPAPPSRQAKPPQKKGWGFRNLFPSLAPNLPAATPHGEPEQAAASGHAAMADLLTRMPKQACCCALPRWLEGMLGCLKQCVEKMLVFLKQYGGYACIGSFLSAAVTLHWLRSYPSSSPGDQLTDLPRWMNFLDSLGIFCMVGGWVVIVGLGMYTPYLMSVARVNHFLGELRDAEDGHDTTSEFWNSLAWKYFMLDAELEQIWAMRNGGLLFTTVLAGLIVIAIACAFAVISTDCITNVDFQAPEFVISFPPLVVTLVMITFIISKTAEITDMCQGGDSSNPRMHIMTYSRCFQLQLQPRADNQEEKERYQSYMNFLAYISGDGKIGVEIGGVLITQSLASDFAKKSFLQLPALYAMACHAFKSNQKRAP